MLEQMLSQHPGKACGKMTHELMEKFKHLEKVLTAFIFYVLVIVRAYTCAEKWRSTQISNGGNLCGFFVFFDPVSGTEQDLCPSFYKEGRLHSKDDHDRVERE